jgi:hypothetical protein
MSSADMILFQLEAILEQCGSVGSREVWWQGKGTASDMPNA